MRTSYFTLGLWHTVRESVVADMKRENAFQDVIDWLDKWDEAEARGEARGKEMMAAEVNDLKKEVRRLREENERLKATTV